MKREAGDFTFPIWMLGDSEPTNWKDILEFPFDDRHPIRHNIWTSIIDKVQESFYILNQTRIDTNRIFIRNAVSDSKIKPKSNIQDWSGFSDLNSEIYRYRDLIHKYQPKVIFSFGAFSYEFGRRCLDESPEFPYSHWGARNLGNEFRFQIDKNRAPILIPLLHRSIAGGKFVESHEYFCGSAGSNYFSHVSKLLVPILIKIPEIYIN